jgi:hypothetical protein
MPVDASALHPCAQPLHAELDELMILDQREHGLRAPLLDDVEIQVEVSRPGWAHVTRRDLAGAEGADAQGG